MMMGLAWLAAPLLFSTVACSGGESQTPPVVAETTSAVPANLVTGTWQVRLANDANRAPFEGRNSWIAWFNGRRQEALQQFVAESDKEGTARAHADYAAMYRQAALLAAHATIQVYGVDAQPTDPKETAYLVGVGGALIGDAKWREKLGQSGSSPIANLAPRDNAWKGWASRGAPWPPDGPTGAAMEASPGTSPDAGPLPHYQLPEEGGTTAIDAGDPGTMWNLARYHELAAVTASPELKPVIAALIDPWRLPPEAREPLTATTVPDSFLFMSFATSAGDMFFLADLARDGVAAVERHQADSAYAVLVKHCTKNNKLDLDCALDQALLLGKAIEAEMEKAGGGQQGFHRAFADFARAGALRAADRVALAMGDTDTSGRLRINALDRSVGSARDPLFLLSVAAWDAGNRNAVRASEIVHGLRTEIPGLDAAALPLAALQLRLSRTAAPGRPMH